MQRMVKLRVYIREDCWNCAESHRIVGEIAPEFPQLSVEIVDFDVPDRPQHIFAVPTYVLNGRIISLGNPYRDKLRKEIISALEDQQM
jgi:hypothetical protein